MHNKHQILASLVLATSCAVSTHATIFVDTTPGTGAPPGTLGGYTMVGFPTDATAPWTPTLSLVPPASSPVSGNLNFNKSVYHLKAGSTDWATWSHGYSGDVYYTPDSDLMMLLPGNTLAFYMYVQPNLRYEFSFKADSEATTTTLTIDGDAGAKYVGFYTDNPLDPLSFVYVKQLTGDSDGFAVGEFAINGTAAVPEPSTYLAGLFVLGLLGAKGWKSRAIPQNESR